LLIAHLKVLLEAVMSKKNHGAEAQGGGGSHKGAGQNQPGAGANTGAGHSKKNPVARGKAGKKRVA
jgi:hypothetical protein